MSERERGRKREKLKTGANDFIPSFLALRTSSHLVDSRCCVLSLCNACTASASDFRRLFFFLVFSVSFFISFFFFVEFFRHSLAVSQHQLERAQWNFYFAVCSFSVALNNFIILIIIITRTLNWHSYTWFFVLSFCLFKWGFCILFFLSPAAAAAVTAAAALKSLLLFVLLVHPLKTCIPFCPFGIHSQSSSLVASVSRHTY